MPPWMMGCLMLKSLVIFVCKTILVLTFKLDFRMRLDFA